MEEKLFVYYKRDMILSYKETAAPLYCLSFLSVNFLKSQK